VHLFGLTGGIASGKSTVASMFRTRGVPVIDADQLAREVVAPGTEGLAAVVEAFGPEVLTPAGELDRAAVAKVVFSDEAKRRTLNGLLHPRIAALGMQKAAALASKGEALACYEAALLVENGLADAFRPLVVVTAPESVQLARACQRDGAREADVSARMRSQLPMTEKAKAADFVIDNTGTLEDLARRADDVLAQVCEKVGVDARRFHLHDAAPFDPKAIDATTKHA
jgi:dephospho-CoA kinase